MWLKEELPPQGCVFSRTSEEATDVQMGQPPPRQEVAYQSRGATPRTPSSPGPVASDHGEWGADGQG